MIASPYLCGGPDKRNGIYTKVNWATSLLVYFATLLKLSHKNWYQPPNLHCHHCCKRANDWQVVNDGYYWAVFWKLTDLIRC